MSPIHHISSSDRALIDKGLDALPCSEHFPNCPGLRLGKHSLNETEDTTYWENEKYINCCPCLKQCSFSSATANWATRYWKGLSRVYIALLESTQTKQNTINVKEKFVIGINNVLRGIWKHLVTSKTEQSVKGVTGCPHVDAIFYPNLNPVYYYWVTGLFGEISVEWRERVLLLATYLKLISHNATKYPGSTIWIPPKHRGQINADSAFGKPSIFANVAITAFSSGTQSSVSLMQKLIFSQRDMNNLHKYKRIVQFPTVGIRSRDYRSFPCWRWVNIQFPSWLDFKAENYDIIFHLATPAEFRATEKFKKAYANANIVYVLPCFNSEEQNSRFAKMKRPMPPSSNMTINAPIFLPKHSDEKAKSSILELLLWDIHRIVFLKRRKKTTDYAYWGNSPLGVIVTMALDLFDWKVRGFCLDIYEYKDRTHDFFSLSEPVVDGPSLPVFFTKPQSKKSRQKTWYTPPQKAHRHEMNALRLLVLSLARIDYFTQSRMVDEDVLSREMTSVCQQVRNLGFQPSSKRQTMQKKKASRIRKPKFPSIREWIEDYVKRHAKKYWSDELSCALNASNVRDSVICHGINGAKIELWVDNGKVFVCEQGHRPQPIRHEKLRPAISTNDTPEITDISELL